MTTITKPRRGLKMRLHPAMPLKRSAQEEQLRAFERLDTITDIVCGAIEITDEGSMAWRAMTIAMDEFLMPSLGLLQPGERPLTHKEATLVIDCMHDADAIMLGVQAQCSIGRLRSVGVLAGEAASQLDDLSDLLDRPHGFWAETPAVDHFQAGRDLALALMRDVQRIGESQDDTPEAWRCYRHGGAQNRFAQPHLAQLIANPEMLDGFSALLSCWLYQCWAGWTDPEELSAIPAAEFEAGVPGEDGTQPDPENVRQGV